SQKYICKNVFLKTTTSNTILTNGLDASKAYKIPIAHGDGRYFAHEDTIKELQENDQILFKYADAEGNESEESNPNGSLLNIAGVCNKNRNVFGMMPHPERAADKMLGNSDGKVMFDSILKNILEKA
ncbi:MAG: phosphoribosylformylglycinamidine (FGAM) synthase-like amidotransferase family enzyme, partial [Bacteroidia bacterium]